MLYLLHGGGSDQDFRTFDINDDILDLTAGKPIIVVMPDAATRLVLQPGQHHRRPAQLGDLPHRPAAPVDRRELPHLRRVRRPRGRRLLDGRLRRAEVHRQVLRPLLLGQLATPARPACAATSAWSCTGPTLSSAAMDLGGGTIYGAPFWDEARVSADNPMQRIERYRNKRIFLAAGTARIRSTGSTPSNETQVLAGQREFRARSARAGIPHEWHEVPGGHFFRPDMFIRDLDGMLARLRRAASRVLHEHGAAVVTGRRSGVDYAAAA